MAKGDNPYENPQSIIPTYTSPGSGNGNGNGGTTSKKADDSEENLDPEDKKNAIKNANKALATKGSGGKMTLGEAFADVLPDSRLRQNMMLKAERKKERLAGERRYAEEHGTKLRKGLSTPNNAINKKDQGKFTELGGGLSDYGQILPRDYTHDIQSDPIIKQSEAEDDKDLIIENL